MPSRRSLPDCLPALYDQLASNRTVPPDCWGDADGVRAVVGQQHTDYLWIAERHEQTAAAAEQAEFRVLRLDPEYTDPRRRPALHPHAGTPESRELRGCRYMLGDVAVDGPLPSHAGRALRRIQEAFATVRSAPLQTGRVRDGQQLVEVYREWF